MIGVRFGRFLSTNDVKPESVVLCCVSLIELFEHILHLRKLFRSSDFLEMSGDFVAIKVTTFAGKNLFDAVFRLNDISLLGLWLEKAQPY